MPTERRDIKGYEGYAVDNEGNVWSYWIQERKAGGQRSGFKVLKSSSPKILKLRLTKCGRKREREFYQVGLVKDKQQRQFSVHRLVAEAFLPNLDKKPMVCHIDSNSLNNRVENLYWGTQTDNMRDRKIRGLYGLNKGAKNGHAKLTEPIVRIIISELSLKTDVELAYLYGVHRHTINDIRKRKTWIYLNK